MHSQNCEPEHIQNKKKRHYEGGGKKGFPPQNLPHITYNI